MIQLFTQVKNIPLFLFVLAMPLLTFAQTTEEKTNYVLLDDFYKNKQYQKAITPLNWFLKNSPEFHKNIYIKGYNVYHNLVKKTNDPKLKSEYQDKALQIYDMRIKHFGEKAKVMNQKGHYAFYYWGRRSDKADDLYKLYKQIVDLNGNGTYYRSVSNYMYMVSQQYRKGNITGKEAIDTYDQLTKIIDFNLKKYPEHWNEIKKYVDETFTKIILSKNNKTGEPLMSCEFIDKYYMPQYNQKPDDIEVIKKIISYIILVRRQNPAAPCGNNATFVEMSEKLFKHKPSYKGCKLMITLYNKLGDKQKVEELRKQTLELAETKEEKGEANYDMAKIKRKAGDRIAARKFALEAAKHSPALAAKVYNLIGDMYFNSGQICTSKNPILARAVYLAAYEMYQKAGNANSMTKAKAQFPKIEDAHTQGMKKGQLIPVGCWIGGKVKLMLR